MASFGGRYYYQELYRGPYGRGPIDDGEAEYTWSKQSAVSNVSHIFVYLGDWVYERRKYFIRGGIVVGGASLYYWAHLEVAPITRTIQISHIKRTWI